MISSADETQFKTKRLLDQQEITDGKGQRVVCFPNEQKEVDIYNNNLVNQPNNYKPFCRSVQTNKPLGNDNRIQGNKIKNEQNISEESFEANNCSDSIVNHLDEENSHKKSICKKRGPYRKYSAGIRREAIKLCNELSNPIKAAAILDIPIKNIRRWLIAGPQRKTGGKLMRRKTITRSENGTRTHSSHQHIHRRERSFAESHMGERKSNRVIEIRGKLQGLKRMV